MGEIRMTTTVNQETSEKETQQQEIPKKPRSLSNLIVRFLTGMLGFPLVIILILWGGLPFMIAVGLLAILGTAEFYFIERSKGLQNNAIMGIAAAIAVLISFQWRDPRIWQAAIVISVLLTFAIEFVRSREWKRSLLRVATTLGGSFYVTFPFAFLIAIRQIEPFGIHWIVAIIAR
jgi:phosphatidate cytidylyltransferase